MPLNTPSDGVRPCDAVVDTNTAADLCICEEGTELLQRLLDADGSEAEPLPMFTSCCPGWRGLTDSARHVNRHIVNHHR